MNSRVISVLIIIGFGCLISCSGPDTTEQTIEEKDIAFDQLEMFLSFEADSIASPADIAFLNTNTLAIFDNKLTSILLYDTNGNLVKKFGNEGKGPGEFARPGKLQVNGDRIYVFDFADFGISEFDSEGNFVEQHSFEGASIGFAQTSVIDSEHYLAPANGEEGSLLHLSHPSDSSFYFGEAMVNKVESFNMQQAQKQISNGEVPNMFKNMVLTNYDDESYYAFLQSYGKLQRYDHDGELLWEKTIDLPIKDKIFEEVIERNENMQGNAIYPLTYASAMQVTSDALYVMMNVPEDEKEMLIRFDKDGNMQTIYRIDSDVSSFNNFVLNSSDNTLYMTDLSMGNVYRTSLEDI